MDERPHWKTEEEFAMTTRPTVEGVSEAPVIRFTSAAVGGLQPTMWVLASCHDALRQQLAEMRANDVRYRHIRSEECGLTLKHDLLFGEDLDAQLDAEIARLPASTSQPAETQRLAAEALQRQFTGDVAAAGADFIANCPLGASQPSRGKKLSLSEAVEAARGHADPVRDLSAMRADCAQPETLSQRMAARGIKARVKPQFDDDAQPERQGQTPLSDERLKQLRVAAENRREYDYQGPWTDYIATIDELARLRKSLDQAHAWIRTATSEPADERESSPPHTDDIVAGLRKVLAMPAHSAYVHVAFEACEKAIAALVEKGAK